MPRLYGGKNPTHGFNVSFSANEVDDFKSTWPCSGLPSGSITFCYDSRGDLVDILPDRMARCDGADLLALSHEGNAYAARRLGRPDLCRGGCG